MCFRDKPCFLEEMMWSVMIPAGKRRNQQSRKRRKKMSRIIG